MEEEGETAMKTHHFVLVHGIGGGGWCWYKIRCLMENSGHRVSCIDLTSGGIDLTDADSIHSFDVYSKPLMDFMFVLPDQEQVILVGHSAGGLSVTEATHKFAKKIRVAVYLAATMLKLGFQTDDDLKDGVPDLSEFGDVYDLGFGLGADHPPTSALVKKQYQRTIIYHKSPQEDSTLAGMLLRPGPILAITSARFTEGQEDKLVPRVYIKTAHDRVVKPHQQDNMINKWPPSQVYVLETDHSPFFSSPSSLFGLLLKAASNYS
ncbi:hypothetical protein SLEP1_g11269 [Rubroshorea leprosula]|uniref:AB hydrolase-1 domain-containing protein n=1 Tax=Rubroshorea leprosula TaxID=152421 RepID=A0AAV5IIQ7_9ROSI|nr:hypothetical protein SLEP1_g11269 [Rubroshorea leprosula]